MRAALTVLCGTLALTAAADRIPARPDTNAWWTARHEEKLREIRASDGAFDVVFFGDSISHNWEGWPNDPDSPGRKLLAEIRRRYRVFIPGFGGDRTYHALWRARNGELDGYRAKVICLLVGTNNWKENTPEETASDIRDLVGVIREKQPQAKLLLMPILPRREGFKHVKNCRINELIADLPDGKDVFLLDLRDEFAGAPAALMPDGLHPDRDGYRLWWNKVRPFLGETVLPTDRVRVTGEPFDMPPIVKSVFPDRRFVISDFGAKPDGSTCTAAIAAAMRACHDAGGGRVVVPRGRWFTGKVHFLSNVNLHLEEGAVLEFSDDKADYLPAVHTTWEGVECLNTSPLIYAYDCENVAVTGPGTLTARVEGWYRRAEPPKGTSEHAARREVMRAAHFTNYMWGSTNAPLEVRNLVTACPKAELRPQFLQFNRCRNVYLEGFTLRQSPFWCIHLYLSENVIARNLDLEALRHNNDGFDIDMTRNVLIENCTLNNADDGFTMKAGRNQDAWRLATPTENVVVRNCRVKFAHTLLGLGSELSGGLHRISLHDCTADESYNLCFLKTNNRRGGTVNDIWMRNVTAGKTFKMISIDTGIFYQYAAFPTFEVRPTQIDGFHVENLVCDEALKGIDVCGYADAPVRNLTFRHIRLKALKPRVKVGTWDYGFDEPGDPPNNTMRPVDVRHVKNIVFDDVELNDEE